MIITILVAGILGAVAMGALGFHGPKSRLKSEAGRLVESLWELRGLATTGNISPCIDFPEGGGYRLFRDKDEPRNGFSEGDADELIREVVLKGDMKILQVEGGVSPHNYVCFESLGIIGSANGPLRVKIGLVSGTDYKVVELLPATGIAKVL